MWSPRAALVAVPALLAPAMLGGAAVESVGAVEPVTPLGESALQMPAATQTALEMVNAVRATQDPGGRSRAGLEAPVFAEARLHPRPA